MKYYYLVNGKLMWALSKMPTMSNFSSNEFGKNDYHDAKRNWLNYLQPCSITDGEADKIAEHLGHEILKSKPIEVTDIITDNDGVVLRNY